jgi:hypothetical protein
MTSTHVGNNAFAIERLDVSAYTVPTDFPESDGTYSWDKTTIVIVEAQAAGVRSLGYTYADVARATLIKQMLVEVLTHAPVSICIAIRSEPAPVLLMNKEGLTRPFTSS